MENKTAKDKSLNSVNAEIEVIAYGVMKRLKNNPSFMTIPDFYKRKATKFIAYGELFFPQDRIKYWEDAVIEAHQFSQGETYTQKSVACVLKAAQKLKEGELPEEVFAQIDDNIEDEFLKAAAFVLLCICVGDKGEELLKKFQEINKHKNI